MELNIQECRNKDGKITSYRVRVFDRRDAKTGKQFFKTLSIKYNPEKSETQNRNEAEMRGWLFEKSISERMSSDSNITFDCYAEYVINNKKREGLSPSTLYVYRCMKERLAPFIGHLRLRSITPGALNNAYDAMEKNGVTPKYVRGLHVFTHVVLGVAFKEEIIPRNYAAAATPPKAERPRVAALTETQMRTFFSKLFADDKNYVYQVLFSLLLVTGCRIGEICALSWRDVDFEEGKINICRHFISGEKGRYIVHGCKTAAGERELFLTDGVVKMLKKYREYYADRAFRRDSEWRGGEDEAVFASFKKPGSHIDPNTVRMWLKNFLSKNNLQKITPHQFRHTSISLQLQAGVSAPEAARRAGHARPDITLSIYGHVLKTNDKHCCEVVAKALPGWPQPKSLPKTHQEPLAKPTEV
ncbi:MAG: site-specific integrase [Oscillospiraceae bacterium]|nr:site-specific integrase [Oscillospiraceae bacterium]